MDRPFRDLLERISGRVPSSYSRWGPAEWRAVLGDRSDFEGTGHAYFGRLQADLVSLLLSRPEYMLGLPDLGPLHAKAAGYVEANDLEDLEWCPDELLRPATPGDMEALLSVVARVPLVVVGPPHLRRARPLLGYAAFVDVPPRNAYLCRDDITRNVLHALARFRRETALVSVSAGVTATLVIDDLHARLGGRHSLVDFGSTWDVLAGQPV